MFIGTHLILNWIRYKKHWDKKSLFLTWKQNKTREFFKEIVDPKKLQNFWTLKFTINAFLLKISIWSKYHVNVPSMFPKNANVTNFSKKK